MNWKLYYADGETFSSDDGSWIDAANELVICCVVQEQKDILDDGWTRRILSGRDYYAWTPDELYPICTNDPVPLLIKWGIEVPDPFPAPPEFREYLDAHGVIDWVKFAALVSDEVWQRIMITAHRDTDFVVGTTPGRREGD